MTAKGEAGDVRASAKVADLPAGDMPPLPRWPLVVAAGVWAAWLIFLVAMAVMRVRATGA